MKTIGLPGVSFGGISRKDDWSASRRSHYQMGIEVRDGIAAAKRRGGHHVIHNQQWLLLPEGADPVLWPREVVWEAAGKIEKRKDGREGRFFDISWPRELPTERIDEFVEVLYRGFADMGLAVQVDWERSRATDGLANDHLHGLISTRALSNAGFAKLKCRALDSWFRFGVRQRVAQLFDEIAEACGIDVRFDPSPNVMQQDGLPPQDHVPRRFWHNPNQPASIPLLSRRDQQREQRQEHKNITLELEVLAKQEQELRASIRAQLGRMDVLTSGQTLQQCNKPMPLEIAMTALMGAGIAVEQQLVVDGIGLLLVIEGVTFVDTGDRVHIDGTMSEQAVRAMHVLARKKAWRELRLADEFDMPMPVPPEPESIPKVALSVATRRTKLDRKAKATAIVAAQGVHTALHRDANERQAILKRVVEHGSPNLQRMVSRLVALNSHPNHAPIEAPEILELFDHAAGGTEASLWQRHVLEKDIEAMAVPGNALSRAFKPHPRFYDNYGLPRPRDVNDIFDGSAKS